MDPWQRLSTELDAWANNGKVADFWWRDDDVVQPGAKLDQLFSITETTGLLLAVIPAHAKQSLAPVVQGAPHVMVAQHGYTHTNHAKRGQGLGAWELGLDRGTQAVLQDLDHGRQILESLFTDSFIPVVVPPWNNLHPALLEPVVEMGFTGVSGFGPRQPEQCTAGCSTVNCHGDPIRWKKEVVFKGDAKTINNLVTHLEARRTGAADAEEPTGFLTHHLDMDDESWAFSEQLVDHINDHPAARWCEDVSALFKPAS